MPPFPLAVESAAASKGVTDVSSSSVRATDPGNLFAQTGINFTISGAPIPPPTPGNFDERPPNYPNIYSVGGINNWKDRIQTVPEKTYVEAQSCMFIWQPRGIFSNSQRQETWNIFNDARAVNPFFRVDLHLLNWRFDLLGAPNTERDGAIWQEQVYRQGKWEWIMGANNDTDKPDTLETSSTVGTQVWAINVGLAAVRQHIATAFPSYMADDPGGNVYNLWDLDGFYFAHDGAPPHITKKYGTSQQSGSLFAVGNVNPQGDITTNNQWNGAPIVGQPDGNGFYDLSNTYDLIMYSKKTIPDGARGLEIEGYKDVLNNRAVYKCKTQPNQSSQVFYETTGDKYIITLRDGNTDSVDWDDPGDGINDSGAIGGRGLDLKRDALVDEFDRWEANVATRFGSGSHRWINGLNAGSTRKRNAGYPSPYIYHNTWDIIQWEDASGSVRFEDSGGIITARSNTVDRLMRSSSMGVQWLRTSPAIPGGGMRGILCNSQVRAGTGGTYASWAADITRIAFVRFWWAFWMVHGDFIGEMEMLGAASPGHGDHDTPMIDEWLIYLGSFPSRPLRQNMGTYDDAGGGLGSTGNPVGSYAFDGLPDWGTRGFWAEYEHFLVLCDLHTPAALDPDPWIPSNAVGGQASQTVSLPSAGAGMDWYYFDPTTYVNPSTGLDINNAALTAAFVGRDTALNSGLKVTNNEVQIGALEGLALARLPS